MNETSREKTREEITKERREKARRAIKIYSGREKVLTNELLQLRRCEELGEISERNAELLRKYSDNLAGKGETGNYRNGKVLSHLRRLLLMLQDQGRSKNLDRWCDTDLLYSGALIVNNERWSDETKYDYRRCVKQFFNWFEGEDLRVESDNREERQEARKLYLTMRKGFRTKKPKNKLTKSDLIDRETFETLLRKGCTNTMERAILSLLNEVPIRPTELLLMRVRDFEIKGAYAVINIPQGKTEARPVPIAQSLPFIQEWLMSHPYADDPESHLWISRSNRYYGRPIRYYGLRKMFLRIYERAGYIELDKHGKVIRATKKYNPYIFRHTAGTKDSKLYPESVRKQRGGWSKDSKAMYRYDHLSGKDAEDVWLEKNGFAQEEKKPEFNTCPRCRETNHTMNQFCRKCGSPMDEKLLIQSAEEEAWRKLHEIMIDKQRLSAYLAFVKKQSGGA